MVFTTVMMKLTVKAQDSLHVRNSIFQISPLKNTDALRLTHTHTHPSPFLTHFYLPGSKLAVAKAPKSVCHLSVRLQVSTG